MGQTDRRTDRRVASSLNASYTFGGGSIIKLFSIETAYANSNVTGEMHRRLEVQSGFQETRLIENLRRKCKYGLYSAVEINFHDTYTQ